ncbi:unnamed protein product [Parnassius apollo]|uniref:(apollo) hypothetical protein n=1 Tax=Parnassius apollo TaxID=110799 RepID=A0A8S3YFG8_PARAO|nr:unnamed protein product [Parnassius apollo]
MDPEERLRHRLMAVLEESDSDVDMCDQESAEEDHVSERSQESDTEQEASDSDDDSIPLSMLRNQARSDNIEANPYVQQESRTTNRESQLPHYLGKDGTVWYKTPFRQNTRIRAENIVTQRPGAASVAQSAMTEIDCWSLFLY